MVPNYWGQWFGQYHFLLPLDLLHMQWLQCFAHHDVHSYYDLIRELLFKTKKLVYNKKLHRFGYKHDQTYM